MSEWLLGAESMHITEGLLWKDCTVLNHVTWATRDCWLPTMPRLHLQLLLLFLTARITLQHPFILPSSNGRPSRWTHAGSIWFSIKMLIKYTNDKNKEQFFKKCHGTWKSKWKDVRMWESGTATRQGQWQWLKGIIGASAVCSAGGWGPGGPSRAERGVWLADCFLRQRRFSPPKQKEAWEQITRSSCASGAESLPFNEQLFTLWVLS